jgi:hypothetical protein
MSTEKKFEFFYFKLINIKKYHELLIIELIKSSNSYSIQKKIK